MTAVPRLGFLGRWVMCAALVCPPATLQAQTDSEGVPVLRGELVRFPDGRINVSIFSPGLEPIPTSLWSRIGSAGGMAFLPEGGSEWDEAVLLHLRAILSDAGVRLVEAPSELPPVGVQITPEGALRLAWYDLEESEGVAILADGRAADPLFTLRIMIPNATETDDWWGLQAALSQAGIRRVQILSGRP